MKVPTDWNDRIEIENGQIVRIVKALWKDKADFDVYKENDDGEYFKRNLYQCTMYGWCVAFPGLPMYAHGDKNELAYEENWEQITRPKDFGGGFLTDYDKNLICEVYPDFRYVFNKYKITKRWQLIEILAMWKKHPKLELILAAGFENVGMSERFWKLKEAKQKEICRFMRMYPRFRNLKVDEILQCIKSDKPELYAEYIQTVDKYERDGTFYKITFDDFIYLSKLKGIKKDCFESVIARKVSIYKDVLRMLAISHHDMNDEYWRHPRDLCAIHAKLVEERDRELEAKQMAAIKEQAKKLTKIKNKFSKVCPSVDGYSIFISNDYEEWKKQAEALHQCIVASGYYQGMADGRYTIVFIQKDGVPQATAQIYPSGKLGQFYANELDRENCLPSEEIKAAFNKWLEMVPKSKFKKRRNKEKEAA